MSYDPMDAATSAGERMSILYGKLDVSGQFVALIKGQGKQQYNEQLHGSDNRRTEMTILLNPLDAMNMTKHVERKVIAESREWSAVVWASAKALGIEHARQLNGKWCKCEMVPSGRKWTTREGEEVVGTTFKFLAFYANEAECAAWFQKERPTGDEESEVSNGEAHSNANGSDKERNTALQFIPPLIKAANGDLETLRIAIASMPLISKHFTVDSPEVQELLKTA